MGDMFDEYKKPLPIPTGIDLPENIILKKSRDTSGSLQYKFLKFNPEYPLGHQTPMGSINVYPSDISEDLIVMGGNLSPELERKGIGRQIYKMAEKDTGKKIIPDVMLSEKSTGLHKKYGLGNEFGLPSYEDTIRKGLEKKTENINKAGLNPAKGGIQFRTEEFIPKWPSQVADEEYSRFKKIMNEAHGLDKFKSIAQIIKPLGIGLSAAGALGYSDMAGAATDAVLPGGLEEIGQNDSEVLRDRKYRSANLIPNVGMLGDYTDAPDTGRYQQKMRQLSNRGM